MTFGKDATNDVFSRIKIGSKQMLQSKELIFGDLFWHFQQFFSKIKELSLDLLLEIMEEIQLFQT